MNLLIITIGLAILFVYQQFTYEREISRLHALLDPEPSTSDQMDQSVTIATEGRR